MKQWGHRVPWPLAEYTSKASCDDALIVTEIEF